MPASVQVLGQKSGRGVVGTAAGQGSWAVLNLEVKETLTTWTGGGRHREHGGQPGQEGPRNAKQLRLESQGEVAPGT